jgi:hypothetical protein
VGASRIVISDKYLGPVMFNVFLQTGAAFLVSISLCDAGMGIPIIVSMAFYWIGMLLVVLRRPNSPTKGDIFFANWACLIAIMAVRLLVGAAHYYGLAS